MIVDYIVAALHPFSVPAAVSAAAASLRSLFSAVKPFRVVRVFRVFEDENEHEEDFKPVSWNSG
jgi:hypothetical protein